MAPKRTAPTVVSTEDDDDLLPDGEDQHAEIDAVNRLEQITYEPGPDADTAPPKVVEYPHLEMPATLQDVKVSRAQNGANYDVTLEVGGTFAQAIFDYPDGFDAIFNQILIGAGGEIRRTSTTRDADGNKHLKIVLHYPKSEVRKSAGTLTTMIGEDQTKGVLVLDSPQGMVDLTKRAE